jgi:hypothetical protein
MLTDITTGSALRPVSNHYAWRPMKFEPTAAEVPS